MTCENLPTTAELNQAKDDMGDINTFTHSPNPVFIDSYGRQKSTIQGIRDSYGFRIAGFTFTEGGTLTDQYTLVPNKPDDEYLYRYIGSGTLPLVVTPGYDPTVNPSNWEAFSVTSLQALSGLTQPSELDSVYRRSFASITELISNTELMENQIVTVQSKGKQNLTFKIVSTPTRYQLGNGLYADIINDVEIKDKVLNSVSIIPKPPYVKDTIMSKVNSALSKQFGSYVPVSSVGGNGGAVIGSSITSNALVNHDAILLITVPASGLTGNWTLSCDIELLGAADYANLTVYARKFNPKTSGGAGIGSVYNLTRTGSNYTVTQSFTDQPGTVIGIAITVPASAAGLFNVTNFSITDSNGKVYNQQNTKALNNTVVSYAWSQASEGVYYVNHGDVEMRCLGVRSGYIPSCVFASHSPVSDVTSGVDYHFELVGFSPDRPISAYRAFMIAQTYYRNGSPVPVLILEPGTYNNTETGNALFSYRYTDGVYWPRPEEFTIACPTGEAVISSGGKYAAGVLLGVTSDGAVTTVNLLNLKTDTTISRAFRATNVKINAYNCHSLHADSLLQVETGDGWEFDNCDFILEECTATDSENDGFNHHGFGHGVLINCVSHDNFDDGFSPHDKCTFAVYGGSYYNNGKGNIIPAFGARGFCKSVESYGSTGLSTRIDGDNWGGFVCLSRVNTNRSTTMLLIDCTSDNDGFGINSAGNFSTIHTIGVSVSNAVNGALTSGVWADGAGGLIVSIEQTLLTNTVDYSGLIDNIVVV